MDFNITDFRRRKGVGGGGVGVKRGEYKKGYVPFYGDSGWGVVAPRLGFKVNVGVVTRANYGEVMGLVGGAEFTAIDTETTSLYWDECELVSVQVAVPGNRQWVLFYNTDMLPLRYKGVIPSADELDELVRVALRPKRVCFFWNRYFDQRVLEHTRGMGSSLFWKGLDGLDALWAMDSNVRGGLGLKAAMRDFLGLVDLESFDEAVGDDILRTRLDSFLQYACNDAFGTLELGVKLYWTYVEHYPVVLRVRLGLYNAMYDLMEQGHRLDSGVARRMLDILTGALEDVKSEFYGKYGMINLSSSKQKSALLFRLGYDTGGRNQPDKKTGAEVMKVDMRSLEKLAAGGCDCARLMVKWSKLSKMMTAFVNPMSIFLDQGRVARFNFNLRSAATLRLSSSAFRYKGKPYLYFAPFNWQQLPKGVKVKRELNYDPDTMRFSWVEGGVGGWCVEAATGENNFRDVLVCREPGLLVEGDWSLQEAAVPANLAHERVWLDAYKAGIDLHKATAASMFGVALEDVDSVMRKHGKSATFSCQYRGGAMALQRATGLPDGECEDLVEKWRAGLPGLMAWQAQRVQEGRSTGSIVNMFGFERRVRYWLESSDKGMQAFGERTCVNQPVQGLCAFFGHLALIKVWRGIYHPDGEWYGSGVTFELTVHDSIAIFVPYSLGVERMRACMLWLKESMEGVSPRDWEAPLRVDISVGYSYGQLFGVEWRDGKWWPKEERRDIVMEKDEGVSDVVGAFIDGDGEDVED